MPGYIPMLKKCVGCGMIKHKNQFYPRRRKNGGIYLYHRCKPCWGEINRPNTKRWRENNLEYVRDKQYAYRTANPDYFKKWYENNKDRYRAYTAKRRALGANAYSPEDIAVLMAEQDGKCAYCAVDLIDGFEVDHIVPLSKNGSSTKENLCLACQHCNRTKHARTPEEWYKRRVS
mgnify:FL=1